MVDDNIFVGPFNKDTRPPLELLLADTEREIARLQQVAIQTRTSINRCSPISSLPPEILLEVFVLCLQPNYNAIGGVDSQGICPLRLSAVCKAWRDLAWATSRLWSVIILINPNPHALHLEGILASWIERAGNEPLSIRYEAQSNGLLARLTQETSKWMNVSLFLPSESLPMVKKYKFFPLIHHLSIRIPAWQRSRLGFLGYAQHDLEDFDIFNTASLPKITRLHVPKYLRCFKSNWMWWPQLRTFSTSTIGREDLCKILRFAKFLEVFNADRLEADYSRKPRKVIHSNLRRLVLKEVDSTVLNGLLSRPDIRTPNLEDLTIEIYDGTPDSTSLTNFITSLNQLRRFKVKYYDDQYPEWVFKWLLNIPSLTELNVEVSTSAIENVLSALDNPASTETETEYLPLLVDLTFTFGRRYTGDLMMKDILKMLTYRSSELSPSISRLKQASLHRTSGIFSKEDFGALQTASLGDLVLTMVDWKGIYIWKNGNWKV